jgi:WD40 repeat protein
MNFSPSGKYLSSAGYRMAVKIWALTDLKLLQNFKAHHNTSRGIAWLDDLTLVGGDDDGRLIVWNHKDNSIKRTIKAPAAITSLIFIPKNKIIICGHKDGFVRAYNHLTLEQTSVFDAGSRILSVAASPTEDMIAISCKDRRILLLNRNLRLLQELPSAPRKAYEIDFSPDGKQLAGGGWFKLFFWDIPAKSLKVIKSDHWGTAHSLDYSPDGQYLATIGRFTDSEIYLVDLSTGEMHRHLLQHKLCGAAVRFSPDGRYLASGGDGVIIHLYDIKAPNKKQD